MLTDRELELRRTIFLSFAATGAPPPPAAYATRRAELQSLEQHHVVVLGDDGRIRMAHPFAAGRAGALVSSGGREWWGNCAWDGLGIVAALGLDDAAVESGGVAIDVAEGQVRSGAWFHVAVPAADWWEDIEFT